MLARSFLKLCIDKHLIPNLFDIDDLNRFIEQTLPAITNGEHLFYTNNELVKAYNEDNNLYSPI